MKPTKMTCGCYSCEREVPTDQGRMEFLFDEYVGQVFLCNECLEQEDNLNQRFENGYEYEEM